ncbi:hypothetical protein L5515_004870 [Caenorhabditis briggsae]|uniref:Uncharacterized protein n=1 Tax=Caenorhabditis briggsae TaxID=6238 RepID=A0AAE9EIT4_CAEBR|nr:hypothetical protein L5515_004870 [Caenorhabditis briggsae]
MFNNLSHQPWVFELNMNDSSSSYTPESDSGGKMDKTEAQRRLATIKQGSEDVSKFFDRCRHLVEIVNEKPIDKSTDSYLQAVFMNGLDEKTRKLIQLANATDAFSARKIAIQEEMFSSARMLQPGIEEDRIHKIEILNYLEWDKLRELDGKFSYMHKEMHQMKKDVTDIKGMLTQLLENTQKEKEETPVAVINHPVEKEAEVLIKINEIKEINETITAKLEPLETIARASAHSYEWIRQVWKDVNRTSQKTHSKVKLPLILGSPSGTPSPILSSGKRSSSSVEETPSEPKRLRMEKSKALAYIKPHIPDGYFIKLLQGDLPVKLDELYKIYYDRSKQISNWMGPKETPPFNKICPFCHKRDHHSYECDKVISVDDRRQMIKDQNSCMECSKHHRNKCTLILSCPICTKARDTNQTIIGGVQHCRTFCPLQEEYHLAKSVCRRLNTAKKMCDDEKK